MPAALFWNPTAGTDFNLAVNWDLDLSGSGVHPPTGPQAGDDLTIAPAWVSVPGTPHNPPHWALISTDCTGAGGGSFNSVTITSYYTTTVTLSSALTTKAFVLAGGKIDQPSASYGITVIGGYTGTFAAAFHWTGGTLNSQPFLANLTITGSGTTALIAPAGGRTVNLGSSINFEDGANGTIAAGTIQLNKDVELNTRSVRDGSVLHSRRNPRGCMGGVPELDYQRDGLAR